MGLVLEMRTLAVDIGAELIQRAQEIIKVATISSHLKDIYIKTLREAASSIATGTMELTRRMGPACCTGTARLAVARLAVFEEKNAALRKELSRRAVYAPQNCTRFDASTSELDPSPPPEDGGGMAFLCSRDKNWKTRPLTNDGSREAPTRSAM